MTAIEQAKQNIARAEELERAVKDGKTVTLHAHPQDVPIGDKTADEFFSSLANGFKFSIIEPKRRRPWTREEAERHTGWVLVRPDGMRATLASIHNGRAVSTHSVDPSLESLCRDNWHIHLPGQPDDLKPCSVEE